MGCNVLEASHIIGKKWAIPIVEEIALRQFLGFNRFLSKSKNITPRILSSHLKELHQAGLIEKRLRENDSLTEYTLTEKGLEFHRVVTEMKKWNVRWNNVPELCLRTPCTECAMYRK